MCVCVCVCERERERESTVTVAQTERERERERERGGWGEERNKLCSAYLFCPLQASESRKIGDYNSANSYLRKAAILATVAIVLAAGAWIVLILFLMGNL